MISDTTLSHRKEWSLFCSDWREGAVFSPLVYGGNRSPELVEGNAEGAKLPRREVVRKDPAYVSKRESLGTEEKASVLSG
jgi:hypothetical protein